jgi:hypothetical protein
LVLVTSLVTALARAMPDLGADAPSVTNIAST